MRAFALAALCLATPLTAQEVAECDWRGMASGIAEPWEQNSRAFANGAVRVALIDTEEPAAAAMHLLVLSPEPEMGFRQCHVVSASGSLGFAALYFEELIARYDPEDGLTISVPGHRVWADEGFSNAIRLNVTINQATGAVTATQDVAPG